MKYSIESGSGKFSSWFKIQNKWIPYVWCDDAEALMNTTRLFVDAYNKATGIPAEYKILEFCIKETGTGKISLKEIT